MDNVDTVTLCLCDKYVITLECVHYTDDKKDVQQIYVTKGIGVLALNAFISSRNDSQVTKRENKNPGSQFSVQCQQTCPRVPF